MVAKLISAAISSFRLRLRQASQNDFRRSSTASQVFLLAFLVSPEKLKFRNERFLQPSLNMISYFDLKKGVQFIMDKQPYEILELQKVGKAQDVFVAKAKIRNLITGKTATKNFHKDVSFEEAELEKIEIKFIYSHREKFFFSKAKNPSERFSLEESQIGQGAKFLKANQILTGVIFKEKFVNVILPIKVQLKVTEAPPGVQGDRAKAGTKAVTLETDTIINAPLFIKPGDIVEVNTETGEYSRRVE